LWCTKGRHWVALAVFGTLLTCDACRAADRARAARLREQRLAQQAEVAAQLQLAAQIGVNHPQIPPEPIPNNNNHAPPPVIPPPNDPLSAVSTEDRILLDNC